MAVEKHWNLNETEGRFAEAGIHDANIEVELGLYRQPGPTVPVGRFRLNLVVLSGQGFVTRRQVGGKSLFDVQIYRESNGSYSLGVRRSRTTPLEPFRTP